MAVEWSTSAFILMGMYRSSALDDLNDRIARLHGALRERQRVARELQKAHDARARVATVIREHGGRLRVIRRRVERLEAMSLWRILHTLRGDHALQLAQHRDELAQAQRDYEAAQRALDDAIVTLALLKRRLDEMADLDRLYARALAEKESWLRSHDDASATLLGVMCGSKLELELLLARLGMAAGAGQRAHAAVDIVLAELAAVRTWSRRDIDCESLRTHKRVRDVFSRASTAQQALRLLLSECREAQPVLGFDLHALTEIGDGFFERILGDCIAETRISKTTDYVLEVRSLVLEVSRILAQRQKAFAHQLSRAQGRRLSLREP